MLEVYDRSGNLKKIQEVESPVFITSHMLKNGWESNGNSFYCVSGSMLILHLSIRRGNIGTVGTELLNIPFTCTETWSPNLYQENGDIILRESGVVSILTEVTNPKGTNINVDIITILK